MIPRHQKLLFGALLLITLALAAYLLQSRALSAFRANRAEDDAVAAVPASSQTAEKVKLVEADDATATLHANDILINLPAPQNPRARAILTALLADYAKPLSQHPLHGGATVENVFFLPMSTAQTGASSLDEDTGEKQQRVEAVVNLNREFVEQHPSGISVESLTVRSIVATLHENMPQVRQVRFLVEGRTRDTLAGHVDLTRAYSAVEDTNDPVDGSIQ